MGSLFWEEGQKTAEGSRGRGKTGTRRSPSPQTDWRRRRPLEYLLLSSVFCSFFSSSHCWEVLYLFICSLSRSSVFSSISPFTWSTISSIYEPDEEGERERGRETERKRKRRGIFFFWAPLSSFFFPPLFIHSFFPSLLPLSLPALFHPCAAHAPPPSLRPPPLPSSLHSLSTRNFGYFSTLFISLL